VIFKNCGIGDKSTMFHSYFMVYERFSHVFSFFPFFRRVGVLVCLPPFSKGDSEGQEIPLMACRVKFALF